MPQSFEKGRFIGHACFVVSALLHASLFGWPIWGATRSTEAPELYVQVGLVSLPTDSFSSTPSAPTTPTPLTAAETSELPVDAPSLPTESLESEPSTKSSHLPEPTVEISVSPEPAVSTSESTLARGEASSPPKPVPLPSDSLSGSTPVEEGVRVSASLQSKERPIYPQEAIRHGWEGLVVVTVHISSEGKVVASSIEQSSGFSVLDESALRFADQSHFEPATMNGSPVADVEKLPIRFRLLPRQRPIFSE